MHISITRDLSDSRAARLRRIAGYGPAIVLGVSLLVLWELYVRSGVISQRVLPSPLIVAGTLYYNWDIIQEHTLQTLFETVLGLAASTVLGLLLAIVLNLASWTRRAIYPLLIASQTVPIIALAPLFVTWMGFGLLPKIIIVILYCFFPIAVASADGLLSTDPDLLRLLASMRASRWQTLWLVQLPGAMPAFFSGLRIAATYSVSGAIVGEFVGAEKGLGNYMLTAGHSYAIAAVFAAIVVTTILSLLLFGLVSLVERLTLPWYTR
ncbi:MAG: ABC transporter permease [Ktedonobacteraceae bacterium]|nr:ABC transporter permease [Ktedonobacteraceae bacterium]